jgi:ABC-2 type transport system permease protein
MPSPQAELASSPGAHGAQGAQGGWGRAGLPAGHRRVGSLAGLADAAHAEWTKLRTVSSTGWLLLTSIALTTGVGAITSSVVKCPALCGADPAKVSLTGVMLGQTTIAVLAVLLVSSEYSSGMIRVSLAAVPRRLEVLVAKAAVLIAVVAAAGIIAVLGSLLAGQVLLPGNGFTAAHGFVPTTLAQGPMLRAAAGSVLYLVLIALFSLGIALAVRDSGAAITIALGLVFVLPLLGNVVLSSHWQHRFDRYSPMNAGLAIQATRNLSKLPIGPWEGLGVLGLWTTAALLAGFLAFRCRDA